MREILFRGKPARLKKFDWVHGQLLNHSEKLSNIYSVEIDHPSAVKPETVGQFTGLTDKNGKKIFEGDIVTFRTRTSTFKPLYVRWHDETAQFLVTTNDCVRSYPMDRTWEYEVIGNIHDNPELLEEEKWQLKTD